ncbi:hypothetical protein AFCDBAGC_3200 [Methylobacterium cerastii]|uniref:Uncharacterized protein n=1 Tax=Methylobacterium cerastii TaxID=932741 RepID=A0ABQ4QJA0_9HYPH|nr:hypothetical protein AFCDBAGC_3200 [Methylobacterium cerastii]
MAMNRAAHGPMPWIAVRRRTAMARSCPGANRSGSARLDSASARIAARRARGMSSIFATSAAATASGVGNRWLSPRPAADPNGIPPSSAFRPAKSWRVGVIRDADQPAARRSGSASRPGSQRAMVS